MATVEVVIPKCCGECNKRYVDYRKEIVRCALSPELNITYWRYDEKIIHEKCPLKSGKLDFRKLGQAMITVDGVHALTSLPATDGNFTSSLHGASVEQIKEAIEIVKNRDGKDKTRLDALYRELRKRSR